MALFSDFIKLPSLCKISQIDSIDCIPRAQILISHKPRNIILYDVLDNKVCKDWSVKGQYPKCLPAFNEAENTYTVAVDEKILRTWHHDDISVDSGKKTKLKKSVLHLVSTKSSPLVIYEDGSCCWLDSMDNAEMGVAHISPQDKIVWKGGCCMGNTNYFTVIFFSQRNHQSICLLYSTSSVSDQIQCHVHPMAQSDAQSALGFCVFADNKGVLLFYMGADHHIYQQVLSGSESATDDLGEVVGVGDHPVIQAVDQTQIMIAGLQGPDGEYGLGIWDTRFSILQHWQMFPFEGTVRWQLFACGEHMYLCSKTGVWTTTVSVQPVTLGSMMGKVAPRSTPRVQACTSDMEKLVRLKGILEQLSDTKRAVNALTFSAIFSGLTQWLDGEPQHDCVYLQADLHAVVRRCSTEKKFWPQVELHRLIRGGLISSNICHCLIPSLIEHKDVLGLYYCLLHSVDIPESAVVQVLDFCLTLSDEQFSSIVGDEWQTKAVQNDLHENIACPLSKARATFVNQLLSLPKNEVFLSECLNKLPFPDVIVLMRYLWYLLNVSAETQDYCKSFGPSLLTVVDWLNALLDCHFAQMVLAPEARTLLADLHQVVENQVQFFDELVSLESILNQIKERIITPVKQKMGLYCIQTLHVS